MAVFDSIWTKNAKASAESRSILIDFLNSVRALAWVELECYIRFLSGGNLGKKFQCFHKHRKLNTN